MPHGTLTTNVTAQILVKISNSKAFAKGVFRSNVMNFCQRIVQIYRNTFMAPEYAASRCITLKLSKLAFADRIPEL